MENYKESQRIKKAIYRQKVKEKKINLVYEDNEDNEDNENNEDNLKHNQIKKKHLNKKTPEEIREAARLRKQKQRNTLVEKYGNEEYKRLRAKEIAEYRQRKKDEAK